MMTNNNAIIAVYKSHAEAETAVKELEGRDSKWVNKSGSAPEALASGERTRLACWQGRPALANFQSSAAKER